MVVSSLIVLVNLSILVGVKGYHILVLIFISPLANDVELLFMCLLSFVSHLWRNVCLDLLPILYWIICLYFWTIRVLYIACQYLFKYMICRYLPFCRLSLLIVSFQPCVLSPFSRVWLCDPVDCNPLGSSVHEILQARILESAGGFFTTSATWEAPQTFLIFKKSNVSFFFFLLLSAL